MAKFRINPASLNAMKAKITAYDEKQKARLRFALQNWGIDMVGEMKREVEIVKAIDEGVMEASITCTTVAQFGTVLSVIVYCPMEYAVIVEFGRQPGGKPPPLIPIVAWAVRHGIISSLPVNVSFGMFPKEWAASAAILRNMGKGRSGKGSNKPMDPITLDLLKVRLIAKKIAEHGVAGRHPFSIAWDRKSATFKRDIVAMVQ
jgi:hypothetical protein